MEQLLLYRCHCDTFKASTAHSHVYFHSVSDVSLLSVHALESLLSSESFMVDSEDALLQILFTLGHPPLLRHIRWEFVSAIAIASLCEDLTFCPPTESLWLAVADRLLRPPGFDSLIVSDFPPLFEAFRAKRFNLLWRGSRDGFTAQEFHLRCDGRRNTLTLISDTDGNVVSCFTPVKWESGDKHKGDDSLQSFLFILRNPHGVPPRKFALREEAKQYAIKCDSTYCASFGSGCDIRVWDDCNPNRNSFTRIGTHWSDRTYANDTAFEYFLTGDYNFTVKEIEVFEIAD
jgi:hypothetical protein